MDEKSTRRSIAAEQITNSIVRVRGQRVLLDNELATLSWSDNKAAERADQTEYQSLSGRFHVPVE
ncbi:MAG: hypothetical protein ABUL58_08330 [Steroidobacter sp.]